MEKTEQKGLFARIYDWFKNLTVKGLLTSILLAFIIIIILLSASHIPGIMSRISSSLSAALYSVFVPAENATMTADKKIINSGEDFTINFKPGDNTNGLFGISYSCDQTGVDLVSVEANGLKKIDCDTPYYLLENNLSLKIRPTTSENVVRLVLKGSFESNDTQKSEDVGIVRVTIKNNSVGTIVSTSTGSTINIPSTPNYTPTYNPTNYYGKADLAVRVLQVGLMGSNNNLINTQTRFNYSDMVGIRFEVRNDGDANSGIWSFTTSLPSMSTPTYNSSTQISLRPGESIIFTLGFSNLTNQNTGLITINVDPQNLVSESIEYNNIVTSTITNTGYNSNYYNNYNGYNYNYNYNYNSGCYINGVYTYNCGNYYNNNYNYNGWDYYNYNNLYVSCHASPSDPNEGDRVRWYADASGGDGDYDYEWTGTDGLDSSSRNPAITYDDHGWKYATVTVESDGHSVSQTCSVYVD